MILGTAAYMAPEQARGKVVDKRADIWAFGVVLYEMLAGRSVFAAEDVSLTLAEVMKSDPDWTRLPAGTPPALRQLLIRCLQKERRLRLRDIGDARLALDDVSQSSDVNVGTTVLHARPASRVWIAAFAAAAALAVALAIPALRHASEATPAAPPEVRTEIVTPATADPVSFALSPDGRQIVFVATGDGASRLWLRTLSETGAQPLAGTEGAMQPFWSPDGKSIGFFDDNELKRLDLGAGLPRVLAPVNSSRGGAWNRDGVILVAPVARGIARVPATGGDVIPVTTLDGQSSHRFPAFLPDGRHFLFYATGGLDVRGIYLGTLDGGTVTRLTEGYSSAGAFLPDGYGPSPSDDRGGWLLWSRNDSLVARRLDVNRRALAGDEMPVADSVREGRGADATRAFSVSEAGLIAYRTGVIEKTQVAWFDRAGKVLQPLDTTGTATSPRISPDGRRVAVARENAQGTDLWLLDGTRETRFTFTPGSDNWPIWAGGERIIFNSNRMGMYNAYTKPTSGASAEELLFKSDTQTIVHDVSRDGRFLLYGSGGSMWVTPLTESSAAQKLVSSPSGAGWGRFSPDGRWIASQSNESGRNEIYVRPFVIPPTGSATAATGAQWQVSTEGGIHARWRPDGRELYWIAPDGSLVAATVAAGSTMFEAGTPTVLFQTRITRGGTDNGQGPQYDVSADGRFLINVELAGEAAAPITLLQNWRPPTR